MYVIKTLRPWSIESASVITTVDPETIAVETATAEPFCVTAYALAAAVVAFRASLKVSVSVMPSADRTEETKVGGV